MRGSIPLYWSQDPSPLNVKPMIQLQNFDPLCESTAAHFDDLSERYGDPVVVLNLVKSHERTRHESVLGDEFKHTVKLLNDKLRPAEKAIVYHAFDFTYVFKRKGFEHVVPELRPILDQAYGLTGLFVFNPFGRAAARSKGAAANIHVRLQRGLLRTNCIDCLDRTNAVQCIYGLHVLGAQLKELDLSDTYEVDLDSSMAMEIMAMCALPQCARCVLPAHAIGACACHPLTGCTVQV
jgi:phosphatidylinositol 3,5-bisphosphate 5-phosphatase